MLNVCMHMCVQVCSPPCAYVEARSCYCLDALLLTQHLSLNMELAVLTRLVDQKAPDLPLSDCYHPAELRLQMCVTTSVFLYRFGGFEHRLSGLLSKHFTL